MIMNKTLSILFFVVFCISSCSPKQDSESQSSKFSERDTNLVYFPFIEVQSTSIKENNLILRFTDSMPSYNAVTSNQAVFINALQIDKPEQTFDSVKFIIDMPLRDNSQVKFNMSLEEFKQLETEYANPYFKLFLRELLQLNYKTKNRYDNQYSSLLQEVNKLFAQSINEKFPKQFPNNSTVFGYNSFHVFGMYFGEISNNTKGIGHQLMEDLRTSNKVLNAYDKKILLEIIDKHAKKFTPKLP